MKNSRLYKEIDTYDGKDKSFTLKFIYDYDKIKTLFIKEFCLKDLTILDKIQYCYKILTNKPIILKDEFEFKNGKHVVEVSDMMYILSKNIKKE